MSHISSYPSVTKFLTNYWWETADLVYGDGGPVGIAKATRIFLDDHSGIAASLFDELWSLKQTPYAPEKPKWRNEAYRQFWADDGVHRVLTADHIDAMLNEIGRVKQS